MPSVIFLYRDKDAMHSTAVRDTKSSELEELHNQGAIYIAF